jgi:hypothetical protein
LELLGGRVVKSSSAMLSRANQAMLSRVELTLTAETE